MKKQLISNSDRGMKRVFDAVRKLRRELIIWAAVFLCGGSLVFVHLWSTMAKRGGLVPVLGYAVMAIYGVAMISIGLILCYLVASLSTKKQKSSSSRGR